MALYFQPRGGMYLGVGTWLESGGSGAEGLEREPRRRQVTLPSTARGPWFPTHGAPGLGQEAGYAARTRGQLGFLITGETV